MRIDAAVYVRISRDKVGAGLGVDRQRQDCEELAAKLGWGIVAVHTDNDMSAYSGKARPGYQALLDDIRCKRVNAVLAWHTDRLHRSPAELEQYISVCEEGQVPTHCVKAGALDLTTPSGRLVARQLGAVSRYEVEHMIERAKRAKLQAAKAGEFRGGRRAFGYNADGVSINEPEAAIIRELASRVLAGESLRSLAADLNSRGITGTRGGQWTGVAVRDVLIRPRNAALVEHHGEIVAKALWRPVLAEDTWRAVRAVLTAPGRAKNKSAGRVWLMSGLAICGFAGCGLTVKISTTRSSRPNGERVLHNGYRCSGEKVHVSRAAEHVDGLVRDAVIERLSRADAHMLLRPKTPLVDVTALHDQVNEINAQLEELGVLWARKTLTTSQVTAATAELEEQLAEVEARIAATTVPSVLTELINADDVAGAWKSLVLDRKRAVIDELMAVTILPARRGRKPGGTYFDPETVDIQWKQPLS